MILWNLFEISVNVFQSWMVLFFLHSKLHFVQKNRWMSGLYMGMASAFLTLYLFWDIPVTDSFFFVFALGYVLAASDEPLLKSVFWTAVVTILFTTTVNLLVDIHTSLGDLSFAETLIPGWRRVFHMLGSNLILFAMVYAGSKIKFSSTRMAWPSMLAFLALLSGLMVLQELVYILQNRMPGENETRIFFFIYLGIGTCLIATLLLFYLLTQSSEREAVYLSEIQTLTITRKHQKELEQLHTDLRVQLHDLRHHMQTMEQLVGADEGEARSYMQTYRSKMPEADIFMTGHSVLDAILTAKYLTMKTHAIRFEFTGYPIQELSIAWPDFCAMIGNILDNAMESIQRMNLPERDSVIRLVFSRSWDMFYLYCSNPCDPSTLKENRGKWLTSKSETSFHGMGLDSIRRISERIGGRCEFEYRSNMFITKIVLPLEHFSDAKCTSEASK